MDPPSDLHGETLENWATERVGPFVTEIAERMRRIVGNLSPFVQAERACKACLKNWDQDRADIAAEWFGWRQGDGCPSRPHRISFLTDPHNACLPLRGRVRGVKSPCPF
jgi:hypothetical protein